MQWIPKNFHSSLSKGSRFFSIPTGSYACTFAIKECIWYLWHIPERHQGIFCHSVSGWRESSQGAQHCWVAFMRLRPGSGWQEDPATPWLGWHHSVSDFSQQMRCQNLWTRGGRSRCWPLIHSLLARFLFLFNWKITYVKLLAFSASQPVPNATCH